MDEIRYPVVKKGGCAELGSTINRDDLSIVRMSKWKA